MHFRENVKLGILCHPIVLKCASGPDFCQATKKPDVFCCGGDSAEIGPSNHRGCDQTIALRGTHEKPAPPSYC